MYSRECKKCHKSFLTGNYNDNVCVYCDGSTPHIQYFELEKDKK